MADLYTTKSARTAGERRDQLREEYSQYVAAESIVIDGVLAFAVGNAVPASHVEMFPALLEQDENGHAPVSKVGDGGKDETAGEASARVLAAADPDAEDEQGAADSGESDTPSAAKKAAAAPKAKTGSGDSPTT